MYVFETAVLDGETTRILESSVCPLPRFLPKFRAHGGGCMAFWGREPGGGRGEVILELEVLQYCGQVSIVRHGPDLVVPQTVSRNFQRRCDVKTMPI